MIEILVTTTIMVLLAGLSIHILGQVMNAWVRSAAKLSTAAEARIAMDTIAKDLEGIVLRNDGYEWFRAENAFTGGPLKNFSTSLRLFTVIEDKAKDSAGNIIPGDISAVAYNLYYVNPIDGSNDEPKSYVLYRMIVDPENTYRELLDSSSRNKLPSSRSQIWGKGNLIKGKNGGNYLAMNIIKFEIDFHVRDDSNQSTPSLYYEKSRKNLKRTVVYGGRFATIGPQADHEHYQRPFSYADIKLTVLSNQGAKILRNIEQRSETIEDVLRLHSEEFIRRVHFPVTPF